jgi:hypothetical protein
LLETSALLSRNFLALRFLQACQALTRLSMKPVTAQLRMQGMLRMLYIFLSHFLFSKQSPPLN